MTATVCSSAARLAPKPPRRPVRRAARASATPPAKATAKPPVGTRREARNEAVATCARPACSRASALSVSASTITSTVCRRRDLGEPAALRRSGRRPRDRSRRELVEAGGIAGEAAPAAEHRQRTRDRPLQRHGISGSSKNSSG